MRRAAWLLGLGLWGCSASPGGQDAGPTDAGPAADAGAVDAGASDAGRADAGAGDAGGADAGAVLFRFPPSSIIYQDIRSAAAAADSAAVIQHLADAGGWGTPTGKFQIDFALTIVVADPSLAPRAFTEDPGYYLPDCDHTLVPVPTGGSMEGSANYTCDTANNDCHMLVYQGTRLYELYKANITGGLAVGGTFSSLGEAVWDLTRDYWTPGTPYSRGDQCTSADAAGLPIAALIATAAELQAGVISHALRFTLPNPRIRAGEYLHPATHLGAPTGDPLMPAYGSRLRLRADFPLASLPNDAARTVARALQTYGMYLSDGGNIPLTLEASAAAVLGSHDLGLLKVTDFDLLPAPDPAVAWNGNCVRTPLTR